MGHTSLSKVREFSLYHTNREAVNLALLKDQLQQEKDKLEQLMTFQSDYYRSNRLGSVSAATPLLLEGFERFLSSLTEAVHQQEHQVKFVEYQFNIQAKKWLDAKNKLLSLDKVIDQREKEDQWMEVKAQEVAFEDRLSHQTLADYCE